MFSRRSRTNLVTAAISYSPCKNTGVTGDCVSPISKPLSFSQSSKTMLDRLIASFPVQLLLLHLKKNLALVLVYVLLLGVILEQFGVVLGIPFLFLDPEYLHQVSWLSFALMGVGFAILTMAFHMTTYMMDGRQFRFLAVIPKPFIHFCINNSIIPFVFYLIYTLKFI